MRQNRAPVARASQLKQSCPGLKALSQLRKLSVPSHQQADVKDRPFVAIIATLLVLIGVAIWQFYSLARGEAVIDSYTVDRLGTLPADQIRRSTLTVSPK
jgi:hypothetical protein